MKKFTVLFVLIGVLGLSFSASAIIRHGAGSTTPERDFQEQKFHIEVLVPDQVISIDVRWGQGYDTTGVIKTAIKQLGKTYNIKNGILIQGVRNITGYATNTLILFVEPKKKN